MTAAKICPTSADISSAVMVLRSGHPGGHWTLGCAAGEGSITRLGFLASRVSSTLTSPNGYRRPCSQSIQVPFGTTTLAAKPLCSQPVLCLIAITSTDGRSPCCRRAFGLFISSRVTVTFSSLLGSLWCVIAACRFRSELRHRSRPSQTARSSCRPNLERRGSVGTNV